MTEWGSGYVTDLAYGSGFYKEQAPIHLRLVCSIFGVEAPPIDAGFTYCELGCGTGLTSLVLAAANPESRFVAVDFNPAHIAQAREMARAGGLTNIEFLECSFVDLVGERGETLPSFDYVTLHGVYSWVSREIRAAIVQFLGRFLNPGGVAYVSYNAMPGWSSALPVQRFLHDVAAQGTERSDHKIKRAIGMLDKLQSLGALAVKDNAFVKSIIKNAGMSQFAYLAHEYLNESWQPLYHADVARDLAAAKLAYVGAGDLLTNFHEFMLSAEQREFVASAESPELRETLFDMCIGRQFRRDVYVKGRRPMSPARRESLLRQLRLVLMSLRSEFVMKMEMPAGEATLSPSTYGPIADALAERPCAVGELIDLVAGKTGRVTQASEIVATMVGSGRVMPLRDGGAPADQVGADRLNAVLLERIDQLDSNSHIGLAVTALGTGVTCGFLQALVFKARMLRVEDVVEHATSEAMRIFAARGEKVIKEGQPVADEAEALATVRESVRQITDRADAVWHKIVPQRQGYS
jgi:SAM-dependent methyltransferase